MFMMQAAALDTQADATHVVPLVCSVDIIKIEASDNGIISSVTDCLHFYGNCSACAFGLELATSKYRRIDQIHGVHHRDSRLSGTATSLTDAG